MKRNLDGLQDKKFDVVIIGGGIYGAALAREAVLRGLSTALIEKKDFASATSANMARVFHCGFRYIQNLDIPRVRQSSRERNILMRIAPHLVEPAPFIIPAYAGSVQSRRLLWAALKLYDLLTLDRNQGIADPSRNTPRGYMVSCEDCLSLAPPGFSARRLRGGAVWYDGIIQNPERLVLAYVKSAVNEGASVANYVEAVQLIKGTAHSSGIAGVRASDVLTGKEFEIFGKIILNAAGPWVNQLLNRIPDGPLPSLVKFTKSHLIMTRPLVKTGYGFNFTANHLPGQNCLQAGCCRRYHSVNLRDRSIISSFETLEHEGVDNCSVDREAVRKILVHINGSFSGLRLKEADVLVACAGFMPLEEANKSLNPFKIKKHYRIVDHHRTDGIEGLISIVGVKYTTARDVAEKVIDLVLKKLNLRKRPSRSRLTPLDGGQIKSMSDFLREVTSETRGFLERDAAIRLAHNYGTRYHRILEYIRENPEDSARIDKNTNTLKAEVLYAVREEMAQTLSDVVLRRTELGTLGHPGRRALDVCANMMSDKLGWNEERRKREIEAMEKYYPSGFEGRNVSSGRLRRGTASGG